MEAITQKKTNVRWGLLFLLFITCLVAYLDRVNIALAGPYIMKDFGLDKVELGIVFSAFTFAYAAAQIPGGLLSERYGVRRVGTIAMVFWSIFTILTPMAIGFYSLLVYRALFGIGEGPLFPNNGSFLTKWFSQSEKALPSAIMLSGAFIGPALAPPTSVWIILNSSWQMVFYVYGSLGFIIAALWYYFSRDLPNQHPGCNAAEVKYITEGRGNLDTSTEIAPWKRFLVSSQFWAIGVQYAIVNYCMYLFLFWLPIYLLEARGFDMKGMGSAAAYPWIAMCASMLIVGSISDRLQKAGRSKFVCCTMFAVIGICVSAICLYMGANSATPGENVFWMTVTLGSIGMVWPPAWASCRELGQRFGGSVVSWIQLWGNIGGITAPIITPLLVRSFGWQTTLNITAVIIITGAVVWLFVRPDYPLVKDVSGVSEKASLKA
jgi:MFS transporter, ACS family, glucarate transporter